MRFINKRTVKLNLVLYCSFKLETGNKANTLFNIKKIMKNSKKNCQHRLPNLNQLVQII